MLARRGHSHDLIDQTRFCSPSRPLLEAKAGYFLFSDSTMRSVYDHGGWDIQVSASYPIWKPLERFSLHVYTAVGYLNCAGRSLGEEQKTSLWEIPVNFGLKPIIAVSPRVQYYFAVGPSYVTIHQHNDSPYVDQDNSKGNIGLFANTGFNFCIGRHVVVDIFAEYSYVTIEFEAERMNVYTRSLQAGGFTFGAGLGYAF